MGVKVTENKKTEFPKILRFALAGLSKGGDKSLVSLKCAEFLE